MMTLLLLLRHYSQLHRRHTQVKDHQLIHSYLPLQLNCQQKLLVAEE